MCIPNEWRPLPGRVAARLPRVAEELLEVLVVDGLRLVAPRAFLQRGKPGGRARYRGLVARARGLKLAQACTQCPDLDLKPRARLAEREQVVIVVFRPLDVLGQLRCGFVAWLTRHFSSAALVCLAPQDIHLVHTASDCRGRNFGGEEPSALPSPDRVSR